MRPVGVALSMSPSRIGGFLALLLALIAAPAVATPRIAETLVVAAPPDFEIRGPEDLKRLEGFPTRRVASLDDPGPAVGRPDWFKLRLEKEESDDVTPLALRLNSATQRRLEAHLAQGGALLSRAVAGYSIPQAERAYPTVRLILPLAEWRGREAFVYVRNERDHRLPLEPRFLDRSEWQMEVSSDFALLSAYLSGAFFILIVQTVLYFHFRERAVRDYILLTLSFVAIALVRSGYLDFHFCESADGFLLGDWGGQIRLLNTFMVIRSIQSFFELEKFASGVDRWLSLFQKILLGALAASLFIPVEVTAVVVPLLYVIMGVAAFGACFAAIRAEVVGARLISAGWVGITILSLIVNLSSLGVIPHVVANPAAWFYLAAFWELLCNTLGLTFKFRTWEKLRHQKELRDLELAGMERMIRVMCHDLSTPLATIGMTTDLLELNRQAGKPVDLAATTSRLRLAFNAIKDQVDTARNIELLKLHGGSFALEPVDLCAAFDDVEHLVREKLARKRLTLRRVDWPETAVVMAEPRMLRLSIIANALSNAVKFSPAGGVIDVTLRRENASMVLSIRDHGIGIPREMRDAFERSGRIESRPGTMHEEGSGFGLMLMRDFTAAMGGEFRLKSCTAEDLPHEHGTTVTLRLPTPVANGAKST